MPSGITTALIAGASAAGGGLIVGGSNYLLYRAQARAARTERLRSALESFQFVLFRVDLLLRRESPQPGAVALAVQRAALWVSPMLGAKLASLARRLFEPRVDALAEDLARGMAATILIAPARTRPPLHAINALMARAHQRDAQWWSEWDAARDRLFVAFLEALAAPEAEPAPPVLSAGAAAPG